LVFHKRVRGRMMLMKGMLMAINVGHAHSALSLFFAPELRAWRGEHSLGIVFWWYGVATGLGLIVFHAAALYLGLWALEQVLIIVSAGYTVWLLVAIWRCASHAASIWRDLARFLTIAWGLNTGIVLFFLQIELLLRYARG
jgi:hypothetical protein